MNPDTDYKAKESREAHQEKRGGNLLNMTITTFCAFKQLGDRYAKSFVIAVYGCMLCKCVSSTSLTPVVSCDSL
jgi:hypothetical protein